MLSWVFAAQPLHNRSNAPRLQLLSICHARRCFAAAISGTTFIECHNALAVTDPEHMQIGQRARATGIFLRPTIRGAVLSNRSDCLF
jgi:hypothetical protein